LVKAGYWVFPVDGKIPMIAGSFHGSSNVMSEAAEWIQQGHGTSDLAIGTGFYSRVVAIDADTPEAFEEMKAKYGPPTYTTNKGGHWLFAHPRNGKVVSNKIAPGLDRRGDGGIAVVPPSKGRKWTNGIPRVEDLPTLPREFWSKTKGPTPGERTIPQERKDAAAAIIAEHVRGITPGPERGRHEHLRHLCGALLRQEVSLVDAEDILKDAWGKVGGDLSERAEREVPNTLATTQQAMAEGRATGVPKMEEITPGLYAALEAVMQWPAPLRILRGRNGTASIKASGNGARREGFNNTDLGNSGRLIAHHGEDLRYCYPWGRWLVWDGRRWAVDSSGEVHRRAKRTVKEIYREAGDATDDESRKALAKHAMRSEAENRIQAMISLAKSEVPVMPEELDRDPWLLNVSNGTLELRTGELRDHRRDDLMTKLAPVDYDPDAEAPTWAAVLERTIPSAPVREFFKKLCGRAFSGDVSEHVLPVLYGTGANGKSTVLNALLEAAGEYGMQAAPDLLIAKRGNHPTEVADLFGMRFVASIEVEDGRRLAESLVKTLTGGDRVRARRMRQDFWEFPPTHKVFMAVNHKPQVKGGETAIWRRIKLISFTETIPAAEQDKRLPEKLRTELAGILRWAVEGCLEWRREGLQEPTAVTDATAEYRLDMDILAGFLEERCVVDSDAWAKFADLYGAYTAWCEEAGEKAETKRRFGERLKERGFGPDRGTGNVPIRRGIGLRDDSRPDPEGGATVTQQPESYPTVTGTNPDRYGESGADSYRSYPTDGIVANNSAHDGRNPKEGNSGNSGNSDELTETHKPPDDNFGASSAREVADFLDSPPDWFRAQADKHLENPNERPLNPLCTAVAAHLYGDPARWREVKPAVADWLGKVSA
jgi:P4 family phage/plasmid primase-like protien